MRPLQTVLDNLVPAARRQAAPGTFLASIPVVAEAGALPPRRGDPNFPTFNNPLPPFGTNPPRRPVVESASGYDERLIPNDPRELWYLSLPSKLRPLQVLQILRSALGGDLFQLWQLAALMLDSWPMFRKCVHEVRTAVSNVKYSVAPYCEPGQEPSQRAKDKADLVTRAMSAFRPDPFAEEEGFSGMVYDITDSMVSGMTLLEWLWHEPVSPTYGRENMVRASAWVHPRHFTYTDDGKVAVFDQDYNRLMFNMQHGQAPDPDKFACAKFKSRSGSALGAGLMRPLAWYWSSVVFCREWMLQTAQKHGSPFLDIAYPKGATDTEIANLKDFAARAAAEGWIVRLEGGGITVHPAQSLGTDNPQKNAVKEANDACMLLFLGQNLTSQSPENGGTRAQGTVHAGVRREVVESVAKWVAGVLTEQWATAILRRNYGEDSECPTVAADFTEAEDPAAAATRLKTVTVDMGLPVLAEEAYRAVGFTQPEEDDKVFVNGKTGLLGDTETEVEAAAQPPATGEDGQPEYDFSDGDQGVNAKHVAAAVKGASDAELGDLREMVVAAKGAPHCNGEWEAVAIKVKGIAARRSKARFKL